MKNRALMNYRAAAVIVLLAIVLPATGPAAALQGQVRTLVIGVGRDFYDGPDSRTFLHASTHTWEALTCLGPDLAAQPWLAESWQGSPDGRTWAFKLRGGVCFHDGTPLTAALAKAAIDRIAAAPKFDATGVYRYLDRLEVKNELELVFHLKAPCPQFPNLVANYSSPVIHPASFDETGRLSGLTATGPFLVSAVKPGDQIVVDAFSGYWGDRPAYQRVVFKTLLDARSRAMALMAGQVDAVADVGGILPQQCEEIRSTPGLTLKKVEVATTHYLLFNCKAPPFETPGARRWLAGMLNREEMTAALVPEAAKPALDPFTPLARQWAFGNLDIACGVKPPVPDAPIVILLHAGTLERWPYKDIAQLLHARLRASGFHAKISIREAGAYYEDIQKGRFNLAIQPNTLMTGEPDFFYSYYVACGGPRYCGCGTPQMDALILQGRQCPDPIQQKDIYHRLSRIFADQLPLLPLYHDISLYAHGSRVADFYMDHNFRPLLLKARPTETP